MFDSPVHDACPGEITACGWPWHGRLDYTVGAASPVLTLPNGVTATLKWFPNVVAAYDWHQHGTLLRFRDPRAIDVERTPEQLAADAERGIEWRADVLYGPREGLVYGIGPKTRQPRSWLYHDGVTNWRARVLANAQIRLSHLLFVIGRARQPDQQHDIVVSKPSGSPALGELVVIDALPDGSRVLFTRYRNTGIPWGVGSSSFIQEQLGAWCAMPYDFWELRLARDEAGVYSAELLSVREPEAVAGDYQQAAIIGTEPKVSIASTITGTTSDEDYERLSVATSWDVADETGPTSTSSAARHMATTSQGHRDIGAYYRSDASIAFWSLVYGGASELQGDPQITFEGQSDWTANRPVRSSGFAVWGSNVVRVTTTNTLTGHNSAWLELHRDGVAVSRAELREDVTQHTVTVRDAEFLAAWEAGTWSLIRTDTSVPGGTLTQTRTQTGTLDDQTVIPHGTPSLHPTWTFSPFPPVLLRHAGAKFFSRPSQGRQTLSAFRFCAQLPVLAMSVSDAASGAIRQVLGNAASPDGELHPGTGERHAPFSALHGAWNPVTGEVLRDTPNPVSYL